MDRSRLSDDFCLNSWDITFCVIHENELEGLVLAAWGQKSFSLLANPPPPLWLCWCGDTQKGHLGCCASLYDSLLLLWSGLYSRMSIGKQNMDASHSRPSLGNIPESYSAPPWVASEEKGKSKVLVVRNWKSIWDTIRSTSDASPPHLSGRTRKDK